MKRDSLVKIGMQAEKQRLFVEKLKKASPNVKEDFDVVMEKVYGNLAYQFRVLCERGYFNHLNQEDYIHYLENEILCLKLLKEDLIDNEGIL